MIDIETIRLVIAASKCPEERLLVGLSRFAALRIPSEIKSLKWADLRRVGDVAVLKVHTPKTGKTGKHFKSVPVCRELLALMDEARRATTSEFMLPQLRHHTNPQMVFRRLCDKAGVRRWKKQTHQLRASCLSDWMRQYSPIEVSQWAGNSPKVLLTHYPRSEKGDDLILAAARNFSGTGQPPAPSALAGAASVTAPVTASCEKVAA